MTPFRRWSALVLPLLAGAGLLLLARGPLPASPGAPPVVTVYKTATCGCCALWVEHLEAHGYPVEVYDVTDLTERKALLGVPPEARSCHTAVVDGLVVEGHVPAPVMARLLEERPEGVYGVAVPGMPAGSPGMEGPPPVPYEVLALHRDGSLRRFEHVPVR